MFKVIAKAFDGSIQHGLDSMSMSVGLYFLSGYMRDFLRNDMSNYCVCYSCRVACVRFCYKYHMERI